MDRASWLKEMRRDCEVKYDGYAPLYFEKYGLYNNETHLQFLEEFLNRLPPYSTILDAACGAGRYLAYLLEKKHSVLAVDQSEGMLRRARELFPDVHFEKIGLQEMNYREVFDGAICLDAIENVPPEDWQLVLGNFHRSLRPGGSFYFTVETQEMAGENEIKQAFEKAQAEGLPVVYGEVPDEGVYHFHPSSQEVKEWTRQAGFELLKEKNGELWYYHILVRKMETQAA